MLPLLGVAQVQADADRDTREQLLRQERDRALREGLEQRPDVRLPPPESSGLGRIPETETPCFPIDHIRLVVRGDYDFSWAAAAASMPEDPALGRCLGANGINVVMTRIQNAIVERGYVTTRVLAGDQDLKSRELLLTVVPGLVRQVRFEDPAIPAEQLDNTVPLNSGDLLNLRAIEQGLENLKRVPTAEADIQIVPAEGADAAAGESDLVVKWRQLRRWRVSLSADDAGNRSTGKNQGTATFSVDNPFGMSDLFYLSYNHALAPANSDGRKTDGYNLHYSVPIGFWLLSSNYSTSEYYQTVAGATEPYVYSGESQNIEVKLNRMLWRNASNKLQASVRGWQRMSSSFINDTEILVQQRRTAGWGAGINDRTYFGRSSLDTSLDYTHGTGMFGALSAPEETTGEGTNEMEIVGLNIQLDAPFEIAGLPLRYSGSWRQQWNRTPLTSQDRFSIGNRYTVRGFDGELTLMGERGFVSRNEIATAVQALGAETYVALDYGRVGGLPVASELGRSLLGTALGLRGGLRGVSYDFFVGAPLEKPKHFETARITTGFSLAWSY